MSSGARLIIRTAALLWLLSPATLPPSRAMAAEVYLAPERFLAESFDGSVPKPDVLWITGQTRDAVEKILGHSPGAVRVRYWARGARTVWILEEIGKTQPITTGIVVDQGAIARIAVLIYRESHGWEVRYPFFTGQFKGATLSSAHQLDRNIDGISGATLSVRALTRLARVALLLDAKVRESVR
jgi:hypothetical protein